MLYFDFQYLLFIRKKSKFDELPTMIFVLVKSKNPLLFNFFLA